MAQKKNTEKYTVKFDFVAFRNALNVANGSMSEKVQKYFSDFMRSSIGAQKLFQSFRALERETGIKFLESNATEEMTCLEVRYQVNSVVKKQFEETKRLRAAK